MRYPPGTEHRHIYLLFFELPLFATQTFSKPPRRREERDRTGCRAESHHFLSIPPSLASSITAGSSFTGEGKQILLPHSTTHSIPIPCPRYPPLLRKKGVGGKGWTSWPLLQLANSKVVPSLCVSTVRTHSFCATIMLLSAPPASSRTLSSTEIEWVSLGFICYE